MLTELMVSHGMEKGSEIADKLFALYRFCNNELMDANIRKDPEPMRSVRTMLSDLRGAWAQIVNTTSVKGQAPSGVNIAG